MALGAAVGVVGLRDRPISALRGGRCALESPAGHITLRDFGEGDCVTSRRIPAPAGGSSYDNRDPKRAVRASAGFAQTGRNSKLA